MSDLPPPTSPGALSASPPPPGATAPVGREIEQRYRDDGREQPITTIRGLWSVPGLTDQPDPVPADPGHDQRVPDRPRPDHRPRPLTRRKPERP